MPKKAKSAPKTYKGKSMKPGGGGQFAKMKDALMKEGKSPDAASAIAASVGRKKYGAKKMAEYASKGRERAAKRKMSKTEQAVAEAISGKGKKKK